MTTIRLYILPLLIVMGVAIGLWGVSGCSSDSNVSGNPLAFGTINDYNSKKDTLTFDTVFTTLGSTTKYFTVINPTSGDLTVSSLRLAHLQGTQFRINVNGKKGDNFANVVIPAKDSIYIFVEVTVNPNAANSPIVITDEVQFITNGKAQRVVLTAWGQNAYYHKGQIIKSGIVIWDAQKPHIILRSDSVLGLYISQGASLQIAKGARIYMGPNSLLSVDGSLTAQAAASSDSIVFTGIRLEDTYRGKPGQWLGIAYSRTATIQLSHVVIDESYFGLSDEHILNIIARARITTTNINTYYTAPIPTITLDKCIIRNASSNALIALCTNLMATNCLFHAASGQMVVAGVGGSCTFRHCTMANVYNKNTDHKGASFTATEQFPDYTQTSFIKIQPTIVHLTNVVVYGSIDNELSLVMPAPNTISFDHCLLKTNVDSFHITQANDMGCIYNQDPRFKDPSIGNYTPDSTLSPLRDAGINIGISDDLYDHPRNQPDIGAIEWLP